MLAVTEAYGDASIERGNQSLSVVFWSSGSIGGGTSPFGHPPDGALAIETLDSAG